MPSIRKTAELVQEVVAASAEQAVGVGQMNKAMQQVDQVTQRNASAAEELASTAEEMSTQAETLQQLVSFFHLEEGEGRGARLSARPLLRGEAGVHPEPKTASAAVQPRAPRSTGLPDEENEFKRF